MTYTVIARCQDSGQIGLGIATYSIAVGGYCPFFMGNHVVLSTQAFANPALGPLALESLTSNSAPSQAILDLAVSDPGFDYRQVGIINLSGDVGMHTGTNCRTWAGHEVGEGFAVFGNVLKSEDVVSAMAEAYRETGEGDLAERLLTTLEAGKRAGGQANSEGLPLPEKSAALIVKGNDIIQNVDLRIDLHDDAVTELRKVYKTYLSYREYYELRARRPEKTPAQDVWVKQSLIEK